MHEILITRSIPTGALALLQGALPNTPIFVNPEDRTLAPQELAGRGAGVRALICTLADAIDAATLDAMPRLRVIANYAVGVNNIDLEAAKARGIVVANTPGVLTEATAEIAVGLMLACARRMVEGDILVRQGTFTGWAPLFHLGQGVYGTTVGIVGAGRIGTQVARTMALGFGCRILYAGRLRHEALESECGAKKAAIEELLRESDFVSLHCPLTPQTRRLIDARALALMKPTAILINTARGPVVDEAALVQALRERRIAGAGLDVFEHEPSLADGLAELKNVVVLPHIGSATHKTRQTMGLMCAQAVVDVLQGREPRHRVV